jgi:hypothetical protein
MRFRSGLRLFQAGTRGSRAEHLGAKDVPAGVEPAPVLVDPRLIDLVGRVGRAGGEVQEERLLRVQPFLPIDVGDRLIDKLCVQMSAVRLYVRIVLHQVRLVLIRRPAQKSEEMLKALPRRPPVEGAKVGHLLVRGQVPLAERVGAVARIAQVFGDRAVLRLHEA